MSESKTVTLRKRPLAGRRDYFEGYVAGLKYAENAARNLLGEDADQFRGKPSKLADFIADHIARHADGMRAHWVGVEDHQEPGHV